MTDRRTFVLGAALAASVTTAAGAGFEVVVPASTGSFDVAAFNEHQFAQGFGFAVSTNVQHLRTDEVRDYINTLPFVTSGGYEVHSFDFSKGHNLAVGTSIADGEIQIVNARDRADEAQMVVAVRSGDGSFLPLSEPNVGVIDLQGATRPFTLSSFDEAASAQARFDLLLDRSGSMTGSIEKVREAARTFLTELPENARCRLTSFNHTFTRPQSGYRPCGEILSELDRIEADGGTDIYTPLLETYRELDTFEGDLKGVFLITDGHGSSALTKAAVLAAKSAPTHVVWLGSFSERRLRDIADTHIYGDRDLKTLLNRYFASITHALQRHYVVSVPHPAPPAQGAAAASGVASHTVGADPTALQPTN